MAETKIYIDDAVDGRLREEAMERFGYGRGSISSAVEEAIVQWLVKRDMIKREIKRLLDDARSDDKVIAVLLFGSYARKRPDYGDVDLAILLVEGADHFRELARYAGASLSKAERLFDVSILNDMPIDLQSRALNEAEVLYARNRPELYDYSLNVTGRWSEFRHRFHLMLNR